MLILLASFMLCSAIVFHAILSRRAMLAAQAQSELTQIEMQRRQHLHEMEFVERQAKISREGQIKKNPKEVVPN